jgi:soluble lytic murein transglycosylase
MEVRRRARRVRFDKVFGSLIQQESGGRAGAVGQRTAYGVPLGKTQMLPDTAREMAGKLGVPWHPSLLTDKSPVGSAYQERLGRAYFDEGLHRTGNVRDALRYYHGGPNRSLWGRKTNSYADSILSRLR